MPLGFHPDRHVAFPGDQAILLDVAADQYRRLSLPVSAALKAVLAGPAPCAPSAVQLLIESGLLVDDTAARPIALAAVPSATLPAAAAVARDHARRPRHLRLVASGAALIAARYSLQRLGLQRSLAAAASRVSRTRIDDPERALDLAQDLARQAAWLPLAPRCLPDGLALHALLCRHGIRAHLIIGVRDQPFAAHCWVQAGSQILGDPLDIVAELTPILVL